MQTLIHSGVYLPTYNPIGLTIKFKGKEIELEPEAECMAIAFAKKFDTPYLNDNVFVTNFLLDFSAKLGIEKEDGCLDLKNYDFEAIKKYLEETKAKTEGMTKEEKKLATTLKKQLREQLKEKYGYALVDGVKTPVMNWAVEPPSIFMSKGKNPLRGHWKRAIRKEEIILNSSQPMEGWNTVWEPNELWIAKWKDVFDPTRWKYVWLSPASQLRQEREKKKFEKAENLAKNIKKLEVFIDKELKSPDVTRRKLATVCWLMKNLGIRVGDERIAGERGTLGCTTLKAENVKLGKDGTVYLDFTGKDYVHWMKSFKPPEQVYKNLQEFKETAKDDFLFKGLDSNKVSRFLREVLPGMSAKVFRTYLAGTVWDENAKEHLKLVDGRTSLPVRLYLFKMTNLAVAKTLNHRRALPKNYQERIAKKEEQLKKETAKLESLKEAPESKLLKQQRKAEKIACELNLLKETAEWNLNTSLTSYISPKKTLYFCKKAGLKPEQIYSKSLQEKFSWIIKRDEDDTEES